jgi:restriction endonuclease S subunit
MQFSIINYKALEVGTNRLDAEYYSPEFLEVKNKIRSKNPLPLEKLTNRVYSFGAYSLCNQIKYKEEGIPYLRNLNIKNGLINYRDMLYIDDLTHQILVKSQVELKTVLIPMSGSIGDAAILDNVPKHLYNSNQDIAKIVTNELISPYYLTIFFLSKYGQCVLNHLQVGSVQQHIFLFQFNKIEIPVFSPEFQTRIEHFYKHALSKKESSELKYKDAMTTLISFIGLDKWAPDTQLSFVGRFKDTETFRRADAEYYQPKHNKLVEQLEKCPNKCKLCKDVLISNKRNYEPNDKTEYRYIELSNIGTTGDILDCSTELGFDLPSRARRMINSGEVIISSIEGSLDKVALIDYEYDNALCSTGFHIVSSKEINAETLLVFFKSFAGYEQLKKGCSGTILTAISQSEFDKVVIPIIASEIQADIKEKVTKSRKMLSEAKSLIEIAKHAVEIAIEESEDKAVEYLTQNVLSK